MIEIRNDIMNETTYYYQIGEVAKMLAFRPRGGKLIGQNNFFRILRANHILNADNTPNQAFLNLDLCIYRKVNKRWKGYGVTFFSERGIDYLKKRFTDGRYTLNYEHKPRIKRTLELDEVC